MNKLKESILNDAKKGGGDTTNANNETTNASNETTSHTTNASNETTGATNTASTHATGSDDTYVYGVGILAVLAIGVCVFFTYNNFPKSKKQANEKQGQPPKRRYVL